LHDNLVRAGCAERREELICRREALFEARIRSAEDVVELLGDRLVQIARDIGAGGPLAGEHFVEDHAASVEIRASVHISAAALLGGHVVEGAGDFLTLGGVQRR
jgi:hypothetical protein